MEHQRRPGRPRPGTHEDPRELLAEGREEDPHVYDVDDGGSEIPESNGYGCVKFRNVRSDGKPASAIAKVDTDLPLMRIAEAYLTFAEAETRLNGSTTAAAEKINELHKRANAATKTNYTLEDIQKEWVKEFWFEGRARVDQVRFGTYNVPAYRYIYPIPLNDLLNNPNLVQNPGY